MSTAPALLQRVVSSAVSSTPLASSVISTQSSSLLLVTAASWTSTPDILRLIFSFLTFSEFMESIIRVSRIWYHQATRQPSYQVRWPLSGKNGDFHEEYKKLAASPSTSPFLSHLTSFSTRESYQTSAPLLYLKSLISITQTHLRYLTSLTVVTNFTILIKPLEAKIRSLPCVLELLTHTPALRLLDLKIALRWVWPQDHDVDRANAIWTERMIQVTECIASSCPLLETLQFGPEYESYSGDDRYHMTKPLVVLQLLQSLPKLRTLDITFESLIRGMRREEWMLLHSFPSLTQLRLPGYEEEMEGQLSHVERLRILAPDESSSSSSSTISSRIGLITLPRAHYDTDILLSSLNLCHRWSASLKVLQIGTKHQCKHSGLTQVDARCLGVLVNLDEIDVNCIDKNEIGSLIEGLKTCQQIRKLSFNRMEMTSEQLAMIVSRMPQLMSLTLRNIEYLNSLAFIRSLAGHSLTQLSIRQSSGDCSSRMSPREIHHLLDSHSQLRQLEHLRLCCIFSGTFSQEIVSALSYDSPSFDHERFPYLKDVEITISEEELKLEKVREQRKKKKARQRKTQKKQQQQSMEYANSHSVCVPSSSTGFADSPSTVHTSNLTTKPVDFIFFRVKYFVPTFFITTVASTFLGWCRRYMFAT